MQAEDLHSEHSHKIDDCTFCQKTLSHDTIRFCCVQCGNVSLCPDCYLSRVRYKQHLPEHQFYAKSDYDFPIWYDGFTLHDDLSLLDGIQVCGHGNWQELHDYMMRPQNEPVELLIKHYNMIYAQNGILEQMENVRENIVQKPVKPLREFSDQQQFNQQENFMMTDDELNKYLDDYITYSNDQIKDDNILVESQQFIQQIKEQRLNILRYPDFQVLPPFLEYIELPKDTGAADGTLYVKGTWPRRQEFNFEAANKAEYPIMYLTVRHGLETRETMNYKIQVLQGYAHRILYRYNLKKAFFQLGLHRSDKKIDEIVLKADGIAVKLNLPEKVAIPFRHQKQIKEYREYRLQEIKAKENKDKEAEEDDDKQSINEEKQQQETNISNKSNIQQQPNQSQQKQQVSCPQFNFKMFDQSSIQGGIQICGKLTRIINQYQNNQYNNAQQQLQLTDYNQFQQLHILQKMEQDQQFIIRGLNSRYYARKHINSQILEKNLRIEVFLLQIARCLGIKRFSKSLYQEMQTFLKNPTPDYLFQLHCIPPGVFQHDQTKQTYYIGIDNVLKANIDLANNIPKQVIDDTVEYLNKVEEYKNGDLTKLFGFGRTEYTQQVIADQDRQKLLQILCSKFGTFNNPCISAYLLEYYKRQMDILNNISQCQKVPQTPLYRDLNASKLLSIIIQQNISQEQQLQHTISCHACMAWDVVELILALFSTMVAAISFGLTYKEAIIQGQGSNLSIHHTYASHYLCQRVYEQYFGVIAEGCSTNIENGQGIAGSSIYAYLLQLFHQINTKSDQSPTAEQVYTGYLLSMDFFEQNKISSDLSQIKDYETYQYSFSVSNPIIKDVFDIQLIKNQYIRPTQCIIYLIGIIKNSRFTNYRQYLEYIPLILAAIGINSPLSSPLKNEMTLRYGQIRTSDVYAYDYDKFQNEIDQSIMSIYGNTPEAQHLCQTRTLQNYSRTLIAQYQMQNGLITCSSHLFYQQSQAMFIGKNTSSQYDLQNIVFNDESNDDSSSDDEEEVITQIAKDPTKNIKVQNLDLSNSKNKSNYGRDINILQLANVKQIAILKYLPYIDFMDKPMMKKREKSIATAMKKCSDKDNVNGSQQQCYIMNDNLVQLCIQFFQTIFITIKPCMEQIEQKIVDLTNNKQKIADPYQGAQHNNNTHFGQNQKLFNHEGNPIDSAHGNVHREMEMNRIITDCTKAIQNLLPQLNDQIKRLNIFKKGYQNGQQSGIVNQNSGQLEQTGLKTLSENEMEDPIVRIFGPQIFPLDENLDNFQLSDFQIGKPDLRPVRNAEKLIFDDNDVKYTVGKQREEEIVLQLLKQYTSFFDILLVSLLQLDINTYLITKLNYMYSGVINIKMLAALDYRPGLAEFIAMYVDTFDILNIDTAKLYTWRKASSLKGNKSKNAWQMQSSNLNLDGQGQNVSQNTVYDRQPWHQHTTYNMFQKKIDSKSQAAKSNAGQQQIKKAQHQTPYEQENDQQEKKQVQNDLQFHQSEEPQPNTASEGTHVKFNVIFSYMSKPIKLFDNLTLEKPPVLKKNIINQEMQLEYGLRTSVGAFLDPYGIRALVDKLKFLFSNSKFMKGYRGVTNQNFHSTTKTVIASTQFPVVSDSTQLHRPQTFSGVNSNIHVGGDSVLHSSSSKLYDQFVTVRNVMIQTDESYWFEIKGNKNGEKHKKLFQPIHQQYKQQISTLTQKIKETQRELKKQQSILSTLQSRNSIHGSNQQLTSQVQFQNFGNVTGNNQTDQGLVQKRRGRKPKNTTLEASNTLTTQSLSMGQSEYNVAGKYDVNKKIYDYSLEYDAKQFYNNLSKLSPIDQRHQGSIFEIYPKVQ